MASSQIEIVNLAFGELGEPKLQSLAEVSLKAETALLHYEPAITHLLGQADWRFAIQKVVFSRDVVTPLNTWLYQYTLPAGFMRMVAPYPIGTPFEVYGNKLYCNNTELQGDIVKRVSEAFFPQPFATLCSVELALRMCMTITGDGELRRKLELERKPSTFATALSSDATQRPNQRIADAPFINCRG